MSNLRWSDDVSAVVDENDTIVYVVSAEVGAMIVGYQQAKALAEQRLEMVRQRNTQIGVLQNRVVAMQDTINQQRAELASAAELMEQADKRIDELVASHKELMHDQLDIAKALNDFGIEHSGFKKQAPRVQILVECARTHSRARIEEIKKRKATEQRITELEAAWCGQCNLPDDHCRENHDGALYAEGCAP